MRALALSLLLAAAGCSNTRPCRAQTLLVSLHLEGTAADADSVRISVVLDGKRGQPHDLPHTPGSRDGTFEIEFPMGYHVGSGVEVNVEAQKNGATFAQGSRGLMLTPNCSTLSLTVSDSDVDAALDFSAPSDLATALDADLAMSLDAGDDLAGDDLAGDDLASQDLANGDLASSDLNPSDLAVTPTLTGTRTSSCSNIDLTAEGTIDWMHWGDTSGLNRKAGVAATISVTQTGALNNLTTGEPCSCSWSDGTPTVSKSNSSSGQYMVGANHFTITVPAGPTTRVLTIYAALLNETATLTAHLSDGSHADYVDSLPSGSLTGYVYTLTFATPNPGQTLTVTWGSTGTAEIGLLSTTLH